MIVLLMKILNFLKNNKALLFNKFSLIALIFIFYSWYFYLTNPSIYQLTGYFVIFSLLSYVFWTALGVLLMHLPKKIANLLIGLLSFVWALLILSAPQFMHEFKEFLSSGLVILLKEQPVYFWGYVRQTLTDKYLMLALIGLTLVIFYLFRIKKRLHFYKPKAVVVVSLLVIILVNFALNRDRNYFQKVFIPMDIHTFYALKFGLKKHSDEKPLKHILADKWDENLPQNDEPYNIVLIVFESFSRVPLPFYGFDNNYMPFMTKWTNQEKTNFIRFKHGMSISGATDMSMPSIYTGIGPEREYFDLIKAPFLWDYAKKAGYETMIVNSQSQEWKRMKSYVNDKYLDHYFYPEKLHMDFINDVGTDDLSLVQKVKPEILKMKSPFFLYYNTNATHGPTQDHSPLIKDFHGIENRYGKALYITDKTVESIVDIIKEKKQFDKTIFIFTADHGYYIAKRRSRLSSFFKETLDIPIMIRLPKKWIETHKKQYEILKSNIDKRISNLDLAPTIYQIIFNQAPQKNSYFSGKSIFKPIDNHRTIIALSTNDTRHWNHEGFGIYKDNESYIYHDNTGFHYYKVDVDSTQINDLIKQIPENKKQFFDSVIKSHKYLIDVLKRTQNSSK